MPPTPWKYSEPQYPGVFTWNQVAYGYLLLDEGMQGVPRIEQRTEIFSIDTAMKASIGVEDYKQKMLYKMHEEEPLLFGKLTHDTLAVRVCGWDPSRRSLVLQPAYYQDQVVSNHERVLDKDIPSLAPPRKARTLAFGGGGELLPLETSPLANTLGVACMIRVAQGRWVVSVRSRSVAYGAGELGCSSSGALMWNDGGQQPGGDFVSWCTGGMARELKEELGIRSTRFKYLGLAREMRRAGKPQLFFFLDLPETSFESIRAEWAAASAKGNPDGLSEFRDLFALSVEDARKLVGKVPDEVNSVLEACDCSSVSEELRMSLALALRRVRELPEHS